MMNTNPIVVKPNSYLTLHYRIASTEGTEIISTFSQTPATLQMGIGQLAPSLEQALLGLCEGAQEKLYLQAESAFGMRNPDLIQRVSLQTLRNNAAMDESFNVGDLVDFAAPSGGKFAGVIVEKNEDSVLFDFNHPLAGKEIVFEVHIIGILD